MAAGSIVFREATAADMTGITHMRTSVIENAMTRERLDARGITEEGVASSFLADSKGWVAIDGTKIASFSISDRASGPIFALFVLPAHERRGGIGSRLHDLALGWLWQNGAERVWLTTDPQSKAAGSTTARLARDRRNGSWRYAL